jgi:hypothetical protein
MRQNGNNNRHWTNDNISYRSEHHSYLSKHASTQSHWLSRVLWMNFEIRKYIRMIHKQYILTLIITFYLAPLLKTVIYRILVFASLFKPVGIEQISILGKIPNCSFYIWFQKDKNRSNRLKYLNLYTVYESFEYTKTKQYC